MAMLHPMKPSEPSSVIAPPARPRGGGARVPVMRTRRSIEPVAARMEPPKDATLAFDPKRVARLIAKEEHRLDGRTQASAAMYARAKMSLAGGVPSSYQARKPWPIYLTHGKGQYVWDVDGRKSSTSTTRSAAWCRATRTP